MSQFLVYISDYGETAPVGVVEARTMVEAMTKVWCDYGQRLIESGGYFFVVGDDERPTVWSRLREGPSSRDLLEALRL